jgi:hypothetical protein
MTAESIEQMKARLKREDEEKEKAFKSVSKRLGRARPNFEPSGKRRSGPRSKSARSSSMMPGTSASRR